MFKMGIGYVGFEPPNIGHVKEAWVQRDVKYNPFLFTECKSSRNLEFVGFCCDCIRKCVCVRLRNVVFVLYLQCQSNIFAIFYVFLYTVLLKCINIIFSLFRQEKYLVYELSFEIISKHEKDIQINKPTEFSTD